MLLGIVTAGIGWWVNAIWKMVRDQQRIIAELQVELARNYMPRAELQDTLTRIFDALDATRASLAKRPTHSGVWFEKSRSY